MALDLDELCDITYHTPCYPVSNFNIMPMPSSLVREPGSSVSIVSGYGLDHRAIKVRCPAEVKGFFSYSLCVQTGSGAHRASFTVGTGDPFPGAKARLERDSDHSPLSSAEGENE
jgi:hypothetical protein